MLPAFRRARPGRKQQLEATHTKSPPHTLPLHFHSQASVGLVPVGANVSALVG